MQDTRGRDGAQARAALEHELVRQALTGDERARRELVLRLLPVVRYRVRRQWLSSARGRQRGSDDSDIQDLMQHVLLSLFEQDGRRLRLWEPARGMSLRNFVGLFAQEAARAILRSGRRGAWAETPSSEKMPEVAGHGPALDEEVGARRELARLLRELAASLSPRQLGLVGALFIDELATSELSKLFGMSPNALYTFRSRMRRQLEALRGRADGAACGL
jgi:DNA-directed RNA polymerase specialized sigma24 family protein